MPSAPSLIFLAILLALGPISAWLYLKWSDRRKRRTAVRRRMFHLYNGRY